MQRLMVIILATYFGINLCYAETIKLKNGRTFSGPIIERSSDYVVIFYRNVPLKYHLDEIESIDDTVNIDVNDPAVQERLKGIESRSDREISIPLQPPAEFDFKTKQEIFRIRQECVLRYRQFAPADYTPSEAVFGQIQDTRSWWGLLGLSYYGAGQDSIAGMSEESRFILNPYILVGLDHTQAYTEDNRSLPAIPIYPEPLFLYLNESGHAGRVVYDVSNFWSVYKKYHPNLNLEHQGDLIAYNARDFGYTFIRAAADESKNVAVSVSLENGLELIQLIHCGGSCGYPGGCNNMSPLQPEMAITIVNLPARICLKLWKLKPSNLHDNPDMNFVIDMM